MPVKIRHAILTLLWVACIIGAGPAISYAQEASERLSAQTTASKPRLGSSEYATGGTPEDADDQQVWMLDDPLRLARDLADRLGVDAN